MKSNTRITQLLFIAFALVQPLWAQQSRMYSPVVENLKGHKNVLVILVEFSDKAFEQSHDVSFYNEMLNELGEKGREAGLVGSVRDYFLVQSNNQFNLTFDVVGPIALSKEYSYYGKDSLSKQDVHLDEFAEEAIRMAAPIVDFSKYDWNHDGNVEQVVFIYSWFGQNVSFNKYPETIHPKKSNITYYGKDPIAINGVVINDFACVPELRMIKEDGTYQINGIGTFCHEFSHCLGMPDMYDVNNKFYGTTIWDLMGTGGHNGNGLIPAGFTSYEKMLFGWQQPIVLDDDTQITNMKAASQGGESYIIRNENNANEYYLIENRQKTGWDAALPGHGLLVLHVNHDEIVFGNNKVNNSENAYPHCKIILADNDSIANHHDGDLFPYRGNDSLTANSTPVARLYHRNIDGSFLMGKTLSHICENADGTMNFFYTNMLNKFNNYMLYAEVERLRFLSDTSVVIRVKVANNSNTKTYSRPIGAYVYSNNVLQQPRAFGQSEIIAGEKAYCDLELSGFKDSTNYAIRLFYYPNDTTRWWTQMNDEYRFNMTERNKYQLSVIGDCELKVLSPTSVSLDVVIHNETYKLYNKALGAYVKYKGIIQEPRAFDRTPAIYPYDEKRIHFELNGLECDLDYEVSVYYYPNEVSDGWRLAGGPYYFVINDEGFVTNINPKREDLIDSYSVYCLSGRYVGRFSNFSLLNQLKSGVYLVKSNNGKTIKRLVR